MLGDAAGRNNLGLGSMGKRFLIERNSTISFFFPVPFSIGTVRNIWESPHLEHGMDGAILELFAPQS